MTTTLLDSQKGTLDRDALLGRILWYTVPEATSVDHKTVVDELIARGLSQALPLHPEDHNVFKRATTSATRTKVPVPNSTDFENWLIRDIAARNDTVLNRRIVVEVVNPQGRKLSYHQVAEIEFERPILIPDRSQEFADKLAEIDGKIAALSPGAHTRRAQLLEYRLNTVKRRDNCPTPMNKPARLRFVWLLNTDKDTVNGIPPGAPFSELSHPTAKEIMADVQVYFARWRGKLNDQAMREWIRKEILAMGATPVRPSGGIYFLEERYADKVEALETFVKEVLPADGECHSVEIPNNDKQREMVQRAIENETIGEIERKMTEFAKIRQEGHLTEKAFLEHVSEVRILEDKMNNYTKLLEKDMSKVQNRLRLLNAQAQSLAPLKGKKRYKKREAN